MASKINLNLDPHEVLTVTDTVHIPTVSGTLTIAFDFVVRDRVQYAELVEEHTARAQAALRTVQQEAEAARQAEDAARAAGTEPPAPPSAADHARRAAQRDLQAVRDIATGWNAEQEFNDANLLALFIKHQAAGTAIAAHYSKLMVEGRLGNFVK